MVTPPTRVLVLGFDAANPDLIRRWAADGTLPNLRALMDRGLVGDTRSLEGFIHSTWPSFFTGVSPGRHGFHYIAQVKPETYEYEMNEVRHEAFWTPLSRAGRRLAVMDAPLFQPDSEINGMHVADWGAVENWTRFRTVPASLRGQILAQWGGHPLQGTGEDLRNSTERQLALLDVLSRGVRARAAMTCHYLAQGQWDLFVQVFTESHSAGHNMWHVHDPSHPSHDPVMAARIGDPIRTIYAEIDAAMGQVIDAAGDAVVLVVAAHGMSHWYGAEFVLKEILFRLGAAERRPPPPPPELDHRLRAAAIGGARHLWRLAPPGFRQRVFELRRRMRRPSTDLLPLPAIGADPGRSRCFLVRNGHLTAGIRLNLIGREPSGVLSPGPDADRYVAELTADLLAIIDERTGRPLIRAVRRTRDLYSGDRVNELPDLLLDWDDELPTGNSNLAGGAGATVRVRSPKIGVVECTNDYTRTGDHRIGGIFIAAGPGIQPGRLDRAVSVMDFAPTLCKLLGVELPNVDGRPIAEVVGGASSPTSWPTPPGSSASPARASSSPAPR
jgi:predicted AlkP superfamily phosphohydrolase/phosphomutase